jgi:TnpA family transposase
MPRRRLLTDAQRADLLALPTREADLARHYSLSPEDLALVATRKRPETKLGLALQLCALRYPGLQLPTSFYAESTPCRLRPDRAPLC